MNNIIISLGGLTAGTEPTVPIGFKITPLFGPNGTEPTVPRGYKITPLAGGAKGTEPTVPIG